MEQSNPLPESLTKQKNQTISNQSTLNHITPNHCTVYSNLQQSQHNRHLAISSIYF